MRNTDARSCRFSRQSDLSRELAPFKRLGYIDYGCGAPFRSEYNSWCNHHQKAYEKGRLMATNLQFSGLPLPAWPFGVILPPALQRANAKAFELVGYVLPSSTPLPNDNTTALAPPGFWVAASRRRDFVRAVPTYCAQ